MAGPTEEMAWGIAAEWEEQSARVQPHTMPLMTLASTAIDQLPQIRPKMVNSMVRCLDADAACFRSQFSRSVPERPGFTMVGSLMMQVLVGVKKYYLIKWTELITML